MSGRGRRSGEIHPIWKMVGLLCCLLIVFAAGVQAAHIHPDGPDSQALCGLCHVAHIAFYLLAVIFLLMELTAVTAVALALPPPPAGRFTTFSLFTRPPPVNFALA
jgi:cytochrome b561